MRAHHLIIMVLSVYLVCLVFSLPLRTNKTIDMKYRQTVIDYNSAVLKYNQEIIKRNGLRALKQQQILEAP